MVSISEKDFISKRTQKYGFKDGQNNLISLFSRLVNSTFLKLRESLQRIKEVQNIPAFMALKVIFKEIILTELKIIRKHLSGWYYRLYFLMVFLCNTHEVRHNGSAVASHRHPS